MRKIIGTVIGKAARHATRLKKTGGQALPGLLVEKIVPGYIAAMLEQLPEGTVVITGTNGKTTTTKMVVELLSASGKRVLTNKTGSNLTRGIISSLAHQAKITGRLPYDIAVFELDEAYARIFARQIKPRWVLALNVTRDQLDRFGEVDTAARMIADTMCEASEGIITNANDPRLLKEAQSISAKLKLFGVSSGLQKFFPSDQELVATERSDTKTPVADVTLTSFENQSATYQIDGKKHQVHLELSGQHNFQNAAAALALAKVLLPKTSNTELLQNLSRVRPAFGRGEIYKLADGSSLQMVLVKNPAGFRQSLASYLPTNSKVMIAINDNIADGRDVSWLWDVDFTSLPDVNITTGSRAADMALRLSYDEIKTTDVEPNLAKALSQFEKLPGDKLLFTTYTAMLWFHKKLGGK